MRCAFCVCARPRSSYRWIDDLVGSMFCKVILMRLVTDTMLTLPVAIAYSWAARLEVEKRTAKARSQDSVDDCLR